MIVATTIIVVPTMKMKEMIRRLSAIIEIGNSDDSELEYSSSRPLSEAVSLFWDKMAVSVAGAIGSTLLKVTVGGVSTAG